MRVCDNCLDKLNGQGYVHINIRVFGSSGALCREETHEFCIECGEKIRKLCNKGDENNETLDR